ncbi:MAG: DNA translocase FtsK [Desulfamplus sp.]|nr:DNA translocase FtsK [Desulfamplus sp.]
MFKKKQILSRLKQHVNNAADIFNKISLLNGILNVKLEEFEYSEKLAVTENHAKESNSIQIEYDEKIKILKTNKEQEIKATNDALQKDLEKHRIKYEDKIKSLKTSYKIENVRLNNNIEKIKNDHLFEWIAWEDLLWEKYTSKANIEKPPLIRFGELVVKEKPKEVIFPALLTIMPQKNVLIKASGKNKETALEMLRAIMLRLLLIIPLGKINFVLIDPIGLGKNMSAFLDLPENIVGKRIWTEQQHIDEQLFNLSIHMETIIQKYLRNRSETLEEHNKKNPDIIEPYRILVIANFPANFSETAAQRILSIANNGSKTGVYTLIVQDTSLKLPYKFDIDELNRLSTVIVENDSENSFKWKDDDFSKYKLIPDALPSFDSFEKFIKIISAKAIQANNVELPFSTVAKKITPRWMANSTENLVSPIGKEGGKNLSIGFDTKSTLQHALVAGQTGSGKSNLLHIIIMSLCLQYSPEQLELYLIDFKEGVEFKAYASEKLPHARVIAIQSERELGQSVLNGLNIELQRRGDLFREAGVQNLSDYRKKKPAKKLPRILLLVDEFQEFFTEDDTISHDASLIFDRLARKGRSSGIHMILSTQTLAGSYSLSRSTIDQMAIRIALQCSDADSRLILGDDNPNARLLSRPGEACYNDANGRIEGNTTFQVFYMPDDDRIKYIKELFSLAEETKCFVENQIIFEGNAPSQIELNQELNQLLLENFQLSKSDSALAWLGEPIAIKPHTNVQFSKESGSNLIIIGQNEELASAMMISVLISLAVQHNTEQAEFHILDASRFESEWYLILRTLTEIFSNQIAIYEKNRVDTFLSFLSNQINERDIEDNATNKKIFFFIFGVQRIKEFRYTDMFDRPNELEDLFNILKNGPNLGLHAICWSDTVKNARHRLDMKEFGKRITLQMSQTDSCEVLDSPDASKLGRFRALYHDEEQTGHLEKFRPYSLPNKKWLNFLKQQILLKRAIN